jgi:hypothetical protein
VIRRGGGTEEIMGKCEKQKKIMGRCREQKKMIVRGNKGIEEEEKMMREEMIR